MSSHHGILLHVIFSTKYRNPLIAESWQRGYGAFSVSKSLSDNVIEYIAKQREHHTNRPFRDEYLDFLQKHGVEYDPRYVFESEIIA